MTPTETPADSRAGPEPKRQYEFPADVSPLRCPHCSRPFVDERQRDLHVGLRHWDLASDAEHTAASRAVEVERGDLRRFRLKALGVLVVLYFGLLFTYSIVT
jgi:hypothetical protein